MSNRLQNLPVVTLAGKWATCVIAVSAAFFIGRRIFNSVRGRVDG